MPPISAFLALAAALFIGPATPHAVAQGTQQAPAAQDQAQATSEEPVLVVSITDLNTLIQDVNYLTSAIGQPNAGGMFAMMAGGMANGIDMSKPIGLVVKIVNGAPEPIVLVPTPDISAVLKRLEQQLGPADELDDGTLVLMVNANTVFIRQIGNWAVMARTKELLDAAPADPMNVIGNMGNQFDVAVRLNVQQIPASIRDVLAQQLQQGFDQALEEQSQQSADSARGMLQQLQQAIQDTDQLQIGINIDPSAQQVAFETEFTAVPGSDVAEMYAGQAAIPSKFASVIRDDAAAFYHGATSVSETGIKQTKSGLENGITMVRNAIKNEGDLTEKQQTDINELIDRIAELAMESISEGKVDAGALLLTDEEKLRFVFGSYVADGEEAAQIVKELADKLEGQPDAPSFEFDRDTYDDVTLHLVEADVPEDKDEARKVFGETLRIHVGTGPKSVYLALGDQSLPLLEELIDSSEQDQSVNRPLTQLQINMLPILEYVQAIESNETVAAMIDALEGANQPGLVTATGTSIENGQQSKLTIGEGVLKAIGAAFAQSNLQQNQQF